MFPVADGTLGNACFLRKFFLTHSLFLKEIKDSLADPHLPAPFLPLSKASIARAE